MRVLVCGDRHWTDRKLIRVLIQSFPADTVFIQGGARGADQIAAIICDGLGRKCKQYNADWDRYGKAAGPIRNTEMLDAGKPDVVFGFHNDIKKSRGTANMLEQTVKRGIETWLISESSITPLLVSRPSIPEPDPESANDRFKAMLVKRKSALVLDNPAKYWNGLPVPTRVVLCKGTGISGRAGSADWKSLSIDSRNTLDEAMRWYRVKSDNDLDERRV